MSLSEQLDSLEQLCARIQETISPYAGRVDYGNLRSRIDNWDCGDGSAITNVALVYETPGGSTDQINVSFYHETATFSLIDHTEDELHTESVELVLKCIHPRIYGIPEKRRESLHAEIRRLVDSGHSKHGLFGHLTRIMQSEFKGGTITNLELRDAMCYAMKYLNENGVN